jgi:hypothetical protein
LSVLAVLSPPEVAELLRQRLTALEEARAALRASLKASAAEVPRLFLIEGEYELAIRDAEVAWVRSLLAELDGGTFPDLAMWQAVRAEQDAGADSQRRHEQHEHEQTEHERHEHQQGESPS